jgi:zinc protease
VKKDIARRQDENTATLDDLANERMILLADNKRGISNEYQDSLKEKMIAEISTETFNKTIKDWIDNKDRSVFILANDSVKSTLPTEEILAEWSMVPKSQHIQKKLYTLDNSDFLPAQKKLALTAGNYTVQLVNGIGVYHVTLANGVNIYLKPLKTMEKSNNSLYIRGISRGGVSCCTPNDQPSALAVASIIQYMGLEDISAQKISRISNEKGISVAPYISWQQEAGVAGYGKTSELEKLLQLMHMYFKYPFKNEKLFDQWKKVKSMEIQTRQISIENVRDSLRSSELVKYKNLDISNLDKVSLDRAFDIYKQKFSDASSFTFFISGYFDTTTTFPLINKYLGTLPSSTEKKPSSTERKIIPAHEDSTSFGILNKSITLNTGNGNAIVELDFNGKFEYTTENKILLTSIKGVLEHVLFERLRQIEGGVYYCNTNLGLTPSWGGRYSFIVSFACDPKNIERLVLAVKDEMIKLKQNGPSHELFVRAIKNQQAALEADLQNPNAWMNYLITQHQNEKDFSEILKWENLIKGVTKNNVQQGAIQWFHPDQVIQLIWR